MLPRIEMGSIWVGSLLYSLQHSRLNSIARPEKEAAFDLNILCVQFKLGCFSIADQAARLDVEKGV
jgi:hypothetical protein